MMDTQTLLTYIAQYVELTFEEETLLLSKVKYRRFLKGQYVVQEGDICQYESFVQSGCLRTFYIDNQGQEHTIMFSIENWWAGDSDSFISQTPASYHIQCLEPSALIQFPYEHMESLYTEIPKLERFFRIVFQKALIASEKRVISNISLTARDRYLAFRQQYPQIEQRVPQYMIASYLGITKEFLSKIRHQLVVQSY